MTRKHFEAIAETLKAQEAPTAMCLAFVSMCKRENSRFSPDRFLTACGLAQVDGQWVRS